MGIGDALRAARRQQGHSLGDVAADTRIRESYLAALEQDDYAGLGGAVYVRGFITSYARFLGLDPQPLLAAYDASLQDQGQAEEPVRRRQPGKLPPGVRPSRQRPAGAAVLIVLVVVVMVILVVLGLVTDDAGARLMSEGARGGLA